MFAEASLEFLLPDNRLARYPHTMTPKPFHQLLTFARFTGLSWKDRRQLLSWLEQLWEDSLQLPSDLEYRTAQDWLASLGPSSAAIEDVWNPLAHWLTGSKLDGLSAQALVAALKPFLFSRASDGRVWVPQQPWHRIFVQPIMDCFAKHGTILLLGTPAVQLQFQEERITGLRMQDGTVLRADWYVAAVPHHQLTPLLPERWLSRYAYFQQIADLTTIACTVIQVRTPQIVSKPRHILRGIGPFPLIACKPSETDRSLVAVFTMPHDHAITDTERQATYLLRLLGLLQANTSFTGFRQQEMDHAVLALRPGTNVHRPIQRSPISNLLLAGAWTDTGWPANLESAIVSGERCAEIIAGRKSG